MNDARRDTRPRGDISEVIVKFASQFFLLLALGAAGAVGAAGVGPGPPLELSPPPQPKVSPTNNKAAKTLAFL